MPSSTLFADGEWNFTCDMCGANRKSSESRLTWDGRRVCKRHKEVRNPLDMIRGPAPEQAIPWNRPPPPDNFPFATALAQEDGFILLQENGFDLLYALSPTPESLL